jgi:adenylate cyclase
LSEPTKGDEMSGEIDPKVEKVWHDLMTYGETDREKRFRSIFRMFSAETKCKWCDLPFDHPVSPLIHFIFNKRPAKYNPQFCNVCEDFAQKFQGGAEVKMTMLFADIRGSTALAEKLGNVAFKNLIDHFYQVTTNVLIGCDAIIDKLVGDEVTAFFVPGMAGGEYPARAVEAAEEILRQTGHGTTEGPWAPVGVGVHTGVAYIGAVGSSSGLVDITALGDAVNVAARLAASAGAGEILLSDETIHAAGIDAAGMEHRFLSLKGKSEEFPVYVKRSAPQPVSS